MQHFEATPQQPPRHGHETRLSPKIDHRYSDIINREHSPNYMHRQIQLIYEQCEIDNPDGIIDAAKLAKTTTEWGTSGRSKNFSDIHDHPGFKKHRRFQGNVANITLKDIDTPIEELYGDENILLD